MAAAVTELAPQTTSVFRPALLLMSGRTLAFTATFFIPVILARIFDPYQFGTYKQLFLIASTVFYLAQFGMSSSLYYFLPREPLRSGSYTANAVWFLAGIGLVCFGAVVAAAPKIAAWLSNSELTRYLPWIGLYLFLMMLSTSLEIVMISRGRYGWAAVSYAGSDLVRAVAFILPVVLFGQLRWLLAGAAVVAFVRAVATLFYFRREFGAGFRTNGVLMKSQLAYALPFGIAVMIEILQASLPQYVVSHMFDPAIFAIFAVGCLQIPLVDFAASPTSDVMMVKMQESLAEGDKRAVLEIWHDTTWKLSLLFFPLVALVVVDAREIIVLLFTTRYLASVPIFIAWSSMILLTTLQVDGVLRVFAQTRILLALNVMRLVIIGVLLQWSLSKFHLLGAALVCVLGTLAFKAAALIRMKTLLGTGATELLPWRRLAALLGAAASGGIAAVAVKSQVAVSGIPRLLATGMALAVTYAGLVWFFDLLSAGERLALGAWVRRLRACAAQALDYGRG